jgi:hypothetical protein
MKTSAIYLALSLLVMMNLFFACGSEYPQDKSRGNIQGTLYYSGTAMARLSNPGLAVIANLGLSTEGLADSSQLFIRPNISQEGVAYLLENLEPSAYLVTSIIVDLDQPTDPVTTAVSIGLAFEIVVEAGKTTSGIDITLYDR